MKVDARIDCKKLGLNIVSKLLERNVEYHTARRALDYACFWLDSIKIRGNSLPKEDDPEREVFWDDSIFSNVKKGDVPMSESEFDNWTTIELENLRIRLDIFESWWQGIPAKVAALESQVGKQNQNNNLVE